jgi:hypothetical protein
MSTFVWHAPTVAERDLRKVVDLGFGWQKTLFQWRLIEPRQGVFNWEEADRVVRASTALGINVLGRVDFAPSWAHKAQVDHGTPTNRMDFGEFIYTLADRYKPGSPYGTLSAIEVWNEPNLQKEWGGQPLSRSSVAEYRDLLCVAYRAAKSASPDLVVVSAGLSPTGVISEVAIDDTVYLQWLYEDGARPCFDALGAHGAGYRAPPWIGPDELASDERWGGHPSFGFRRVEQLREVMVLNGDAEKQIWLTEFGWTSDSIHPSYAHHRVTEEEKALYIVEAYRWAYFNWQPWIGVMIVWTMAAPDWDETREEYWWAITNPDGSDRAAFSALLKARRDGYLP